MILSKLQVEPFYSVEGLPPLKCCPFCGEEAEVCTTKPSDGLVTFIVKCPHCGASADFAHRPGLAVEKWNLRSGE